MFPVSESEVTYSWELAQSTDYERYVCVCVCVRVCWERWPELRCETSDETREKQQHCPLGSTGVTSICSWREHTHPNPIYTWTHVCTQACTPVWHSTLCFQRSTFRAWMSQVYMPKLEGPFSACVTFLSDDGARQLRKPPVSDKSIRRELSSWLNYLQRCDVTAKKLFCYLHTS